MDFQEFASKETSGFVERLAKAAAAQADDARARARDEAQNIIDGIRQELHERTTDLTARTMELDARSSELAARTKELDARTNELAARTGEKDALDKAVKEARAELDQAHAEIDKARAETEAIRASADALRADAESLRTTVESVRAEADRTRADAESARAEEEKQRKALAAQLDASSSKLEAALAAEKTLRQKLTDAEKEIARQRAEADAAAQAAALREQMARSAPQPLDRLLAIFDQFAKAMTVGDVLTSLVQGLATEFPRVAAFSVGVNHLEGLHQAGFDFKNDISKVVIPMTMDSLLTQAATSGRVHGYVGSELNENSCAPFGGTPAFVLTLPIAVRGQTIAVVYADTAEQQPSSGAAQRGVKFAELLLWHAVPMLSKLSVDQEATAEIRKYAALLLTEIENMTPATDWTPRR
jgi:myosin heavy subunit